MNARTKAVTVMRVCATRRIIPTGRRAASGFTIVEMMIAMTVSLFIVGALIVVVLGSSATSASRERSSELQTNGRYAIEQIKRDLLHAGYLGISSLFAPDQAMSVANPGPPAIPAIAVANACDTNNVGRLSGRIWGARESNPYSATCIAAANYARGDVLVIRGLNPTLAAAPFSTSLVYYRSAYEGGAPFIGPTAPDFTGSSKNPPYLDYLIDETVYYISPYTISATESPKVPALYRMRLSSGPAMVAELVASGVENLQIRYGIFQTNDTVRYLAADGLSSADWDLVRSVQVFLLMRAASPEPGYVNDTTYSMGGTDYIVNDGYPRLLLTAVIQLRN
jgi:type IV pilus assembly protein PilW